MDLCDRVLGCSGLTTAGAGAINYGTGFSVQFFETDLVVQSSITSSLLDSSAESTALGETLGDALSYKIPAESS